MVWTRTPPAPITVHAPSWWVTPPIYDDLVTPCWFAKPTAVLHAFAEVEIDATGLAAAGVVGSASAAITALSETATAHTADLGILGEGDLFPAAAAVTADATVTIDATGDDFDGGVADAGFPYVFPFVFGGSLVSNFHTTGPATVTIDATAETAVAVGAEADIPIIAFPGPPGSGFPYTFPFILGGPTTPNLAFPYTFPFTFGEEPGPGDNTEFPYTFPFELA